MFSPLRNKLAFIMAMLMQILFAMALLPSAAHSQNLYINKLSVWHSTSSAYCHNIDYHFTTNINSFSIPIEYIIQYDMLVYSTNTLTDATGTTGYNGTAATCNLGAVDPDEDMEDVEIGWYPYTSGLVSGTMNRNATIDGEGDGTTTSFSGNVTLDLVRDNVRYFDGTTIARTCRSEAGRTSYTSSNISSSILASEFETGSGTSSGSGGGCGSGSTSCGWRVQSNAFMVGGSTSTAETCSYEGSSPDSWCYLKDSSYGELATRRFFPDGGQVQFSANVYSESGYDLLIFYIDGKEVKYTSGNNADLSCGASEAACKLTPGIHTLRWVYGKDGSIGSNGDYAKITSLTLPANYLTGNPNNTVYSTQKYRTDSNATATVVNGTDLDVQVSTSIGPVVCAAGPALCRSGTKRFVYPYKSVANSMVGFSGRNTFENVVVYPSGAKNVSFFNSGPWEKSARIEFEKPRWVSNTAGYEYPNSCLSVCASVQCASSTSPITFGVDELNFEIFKFQAGTNPLDSSSAPPIKTISVFNLGNGHRCNFSDAASTLKPQNFGTYCAAWDASYNLNGDFGKTNGYYGFRATAKTSQTTSEGTSIDIQQTSAYPGQNQIPIQVDVTNIHNVISSVTAVGKATIVPARPYNFKYQLSKDATTTIAIYDADARHNCVEDDIGSMVNFSCKIKTLADKQPKVGEGNTDNPIANGDFWDGRNEAGAVVPAGSYIAVFDATTNDQFATDPAMTVYKQMTLDPLQITDFGVRPLGYSPTDYAVISYMLTEAATVVVRIYPPDTTFADTSLPGYLSNGSCLAGDGSKCKESHIRNNMLGPGYLREFIEEKNARVTSYTQWDGRSQDGTPLCDGNYVYAIYAVMPSEGSFGPSGDVAGTWNGVTTKRIYTGTIPIIRGPVISSFSPSSTIIGSSPTASGLEPFYFSYLPVRDTTVNLKIFSIDKDNRKIKEVRTVVSSGTRTGGFSNRDIWDGLDNDGNFVSSGTYLAQLETTDPFNCENNRVSTRTAIIPVNLLRTVDVMTTPLLSASSAQATLSYNLSETMNIDFKIYEPGVVLRPYSEGDASPNWPEGIVNAADKDKYVYSLDGPRPRRMKITEAWDGKDNNGNMVADGIYPYVLKAYSTQRDGVTKVYSSDVTYGYITVSRGQLIFNKFRVFPTIPTTYNSSETVNLPPYGIEYSLSRQSTVTIKVVDWQDVTKVYADVVKGENREPDIQHTDYWDGKCTTSDYPAVCNKFDFIKDGSYKIMVVAEDADQLQSLRKPATAYTVVDVAPLKIFDVSISEVGPGTPGVISYQVSEPMSVITKIYEPGTVLPNNFDEPPASIVKRMIGVKSARVQIDDIWDGTDLTMFPVDDGTYVFTIFGTTVTSAVNGTTGALSSFSIRKDYDAEWNGYPTAYTIPVSRGGSIDVCNSFENDSYFAPNPYTGKNGWFRIPVKATGYVSLKIYNIAGELVYSKNYGKRGADESINGKGKCGVTHTHEACWTKVNNSGQELARGVYFAVLRFEAADGSKSVCQTVKKILIP